MVSTITFNLSRLFKNTFNLVNIPSLLKKNKQNVYLGLMKIFFLSMSVTMMLAFLPIAYADTTVPTVTPVKYRVYYVFLMLILCSIILLLLIAVFIPEYRYLLKFMAMAIIYLLLGVMITVLFVCLLEGFIHLFIEPGHVVNTLTTVTVQKQALPFDPTFAKKYLCIRQSGQSHFMTFKDVFKPLNVPSSADVAFSNFVDNFNAYRHQCNLMIEGGKLPIAERKDYQAYMNLVDKHGVKKVFEIYQWSLNNPGRYKQIYNDLHLHNDYVDADVLKKLLEVYKLPYLSNTVDIGVNTDITDLPFKSDGLSSSSGVNVIDSNVMEPNVMEPNVVEPNVVEPNVSARPSSVADPV
jgi:hypothetical protein